MIVVHIITGLNDGGAEGVLFRLCMADKSNTHIVISMRDEGKYGYMLRQSEIDVFCLNMPRGRLTFSGVRLLYQLLREINPDVVQTWMYHADLIGGLLARTAHVKRVFWGVRHSDLEHSQSGKSTIIVAKLCAMLSSWIPTRIVSCSNRGIETHKTLGYNKEKFTFIPNGYNLEQFFPSHVSGNMIREGLGVSNDTPLLGMVARYNSQKDHNNLLLALGKLKLNKVNFSCALIGDKMISANTELMSIINSCGLNRNIMLLGQRNDIPNIMNALDIHVLSSSSGEGFPNVLCEAMACGTVCVTTDVGDAAIIVDDTGWVVAPRSPDLLYQAIFDAIIERNETPDRWKYRKNFARKRMAEYYSIDKMIYHFHKLWSVSEK